MNITKIELKKIIKQHKLWVDGENEDGGRADLSNMDLRDADFHGADLRDADLRDADLENANFHGADLRDADLRDADLHNANLQYAYLRFADLRGADLKDADLHDAYLCDADLRDADLRDADLRGADLRNADLRGAILPDYEIVQADTEIVGYKKSREGYLITLRIDKTAKRCNSLVGRKCRAESATVVKIEVKEGQTVTQAKSQFNPGVIYTVGEVIRAGEYDADIRIECTGGIHFFITKKEAVNY